MKLNNKIKKIQILFLILHSDYSDNNIKNNESDINKKQIYKFKNTALEIMRLSKLDETLNKILGKEKV